MVQTHRHVAVLDVTYTLNLIPALDIIQLRLKENLVDTLLSLPAQCTAAPVISVSVVRLWLGSGGSEEGNRIEQLFRHEALDRVSSGRMESPFRYSATPPSTASASFPPPGDVKCKKFPLQNPSIIHSFTFILQTYTQQ